MGVNVLFIRTMNHLRKHFFPTESCVKNEVQEVDRPLVRSLPSPLNSSGSSLLVTVLKTLRNTRGQPAVYAGGEVGLDRALEQQLQQLVFEVPYLFISPAIVSKQG